MRRLLAIGLLLAAGALFACGGGGDDDREEPAATREAPTESVFADAQRVEADDDPSLPGEYVDLPGMYGGMYAGEPNTAPHVRDFVDYSVQGLPPAGGPHWGSGPCPDDPEDAAEFCGPVPWGIYRAPWRAESLVHNMEHAGIVIWYDTTDQDVIDQLEDFATEQLNNDTLLVLTPYPDMTDETVAITVWSRRDVMPADELDLARLDRFISALACRFNPEQFPCTG